MNQPKISYFADFGSPRWTGGGQRFARELLQILQSLPIDLTVFGAARSRLDGSGTLSPSIIPIELPAHGLGDPEAGIPWAWRLRRHLSKMAPQRLYIFDQPMTWLPVLPSAPALAMFHGATSFQMDPRHPRVSLRRLLWQRPFLKPVHLGLLTKKLGAPIFNSRFTLQTLAQNFGLNPAGLESNVTYLPVSMSRYRRNPEKRRQIREKLKIASNDIVIAYLANFTPAKQAEKVPPIVFALLKRFPGRLRFLFVGSAVASAPIDGLLTLPETRERCIRIGEVPFDEAGDYYGAGDIAISTSKSETFGYSIVEAMASGLPFVAYPGGAIQELIENGTTGFAAQNEPEFIEALSALIEHSAFRKKTGEAGLRRAQKLFSADAFQKRFLTVLSREFQLNF